MNKKASKAKAPRDPVKDLVKENDKVMSDMIKTLARESDAAMDMILRETESILGGLSKNIEDGKITKVQARISKAFKATNSLADVHLRAIAKLLKPIQFPVTFKFISDKEYQMSFDNGKPQTYKIK